ncbi:MAG: hypothetical protein WHV26_06065 [Spirochaetota bacterium]
MHFETTTCVSLNNMVLLDIYAKRLNISIRSLVVYLLMFAAKNEKKRPVAFKRISYRKRKKDEKWKRLHLVLYQSEYEFILDVKKLWKMSLALCIEFCLENVLHEFIEFVLNNEKRKDTDNYLYYYRNRSYTFDFYQEKGIHCCKFYWGPPPQLLNKKITLELS